jgi:hypothetical protein
LERARALSERGCNAGRKGERHGEGSRHHFFGIPRARIALEQPVGLFGLGLTLIFENPGHVLLP